MKKIICSLLLASTQALAIVNGVDVDEDQYPHIVRLVLSEEKIESEQLNIENIKRLSKCTGVAISDSQVLTAGHCVHGQNTTYQSIVFVKKIKQDTSYALIPNVETSSNYIYEEPEKTTEKTIVPGCSLKPRPVTKTKTLDLAVVTFPKNTFQNFAKIDFNYQPHIGDKLTILGFGTTKNSFVNQIPAQDITTSSAEYHRVGSTGATTELQVKDDKGESKFTIDFKAGFYNPSYSSDLPVFKRVIDSGGATSFTQGQVGFAVLHHPSLGDVTTMLESNMSSSIDSIGPIRIKTLINGSPQPLFEGFPEQ